ncbi:MAG: Lrp/AsnC family transcriptional regulator [Granulosicoccus sp.]
MPVDAKNRKILSLLEKDARLSATEIGRRVGLSRTAVQDRIGKLERSGTILGYHAVLANPEIKTVEALIFMTVAARPCDTALKWLSALNGIEQVYSLSGELDAVARVRVGTTEELSVLNDTIKSNDLIEISTSQVILKSL